MTDDTVPLLKTRFDALSQHIPDENIEFWFARELMEPLGYSRWENFQAVVERAIDSCKSTGYNETDHFRGVTKMVRVGSGAERPVDDFLLTRYACRLVAQNGEQLPAAKDIKKLERRVKSDEKRLEKQSGKLPKPNSEK